MKSKLYLIICLLCCALPACYLYFFAKDRFMSKSQFSIIVEDQSSADVSAGLLSLVGGGAASASSDLQSTIGFIHSADLLLKLEVEFDLIEHYKTPDIDYVFKLEKDASLESRLEYYRKRIHAKFNPVTGLIDLGVETFDPKLSLKLSQKILSDTEQFINSLNKNVANERLKFVKTELDRAQQVVAQNKKELLSFQNKHQIIRPEAVIAARLEAIQGLKLDKIQKEIKLSTLRATSNASPMIPELVTTIKKIKEEVAVQESKLSGPEQEKLTQISANFQELELNTTFAVKLSEGAQILLEKTRAEAITKSRFFSVIQNPYLAEEYTNPRRLYLSVTFAVCILLTFYVFRAFWLSIFDRV